MKRLLRPKAVVPMGVALGLIVLWDRGAIPVPFVADAGPILRAAIAVGIALVGGLLGYGALLLVSRLWPRTRRAHDADE